MIAGHSNMVPALVDLFEAWPDAPEAKRPNLDHDEFDRSFVVTVISGQTYLVQELRY